MTGSRISPRSSRVLVSLALSLIVPVSAAAQTVVVRQGRRGTACLTWLACVPQWIETLLGLGGVLALAGIIWGFYNYAIAKGNQRRLDAGRHAIVGSLLLLVILTFVHAVLSWVFRLAGFV